jgi:hypothetical protein
MTRVLFFSLMLSIACGDDSSPGGDAGAPRTDAGARDAGGAADAGGSDAGGSTDGGSSDAAGSDAATADAATGDAGIPGAGAVGSDCTSDADCEGGVCLDYAELDDGCMGRVCSIRCPMVDGRAFCETVFGDIAGLDCDPGPPRVMSQVCLLRTWEDMFCP